MRLRLYGALLLVTVLSVLGAQDFYDPDIVNTIQLTFTQSNWDQLLDNLHHAGDGRLLGTATINGVTFDSVGVRYKGNSSYSANRVKNPWNIMLDHVISGQKYGPYGTIKLSNGFSDPSLLRETLGYEIGRKYMPSSKANYANLYVNGTLIGVYTSVQDLDDYFGECNFGTGDLTRIKGIGDQPTLWSIWAYLGTNPSSYTSKYELDSGEDMSHFIEFLNVFNNNPTQVETVFNVDRHLWMVAFDWLFVNLDAPVNFGHNYYLYEDTAFRFNSVLWDLNMCFGQFRQLLSGGNLNSTTMQNLDPMTHSSHSSYPILNKILQVPLYKRMYIAHMRTMIEENITNGWLASRGAELQAIVGPSVQADPNYFYTYTNFLNNLNSTINVSGGGPGGGSVIGLTQLMNGRATYLLSSTNFQGTVPTISNLTYYPPIPEPL
ncbi:MAG: CotH kinase family protein, partial [Candidatus Cloacimonetes bacterium]|nr:CotH kinase family protein [Candidatus Cloacimonadota bacterium]